jgi:hypothetical protein
LKNKEKMREENGRVQQRTRDNMSDKTSSYPCRENAAKFWMLNILKLIKSGRIQITIVVPDNQS